MNVVTVVLSGLRHYWLIHVATLLAVAVTVAVLTGALSVGDSMRGSLRELTLQRLGPVERVIVSTSLMDRQTPSEWVKTPEFQAVYRECVPALHFPAATLEVLERQQNSASDRGADTKSDQVAADSTSVAFWGVDDGFARLHWGREAFPVPTGPEIVLNKTAATRLGLQSSDVGSNLALRIGKPSDVPAESFIATKNDLVSSLTRLKLVAIIEDDGVGRLGLSPSTEVPANAYVNLDHAQRVIPEATRQVRADQVLVNTLLVTSTSATTVVSEDLAAAAVLAFRPTLLDAGVKLIHVQQGALDYYSLSSTRMLLDEGQQRLLETALQGIEHQSVLTYLANDIQVSAKSAPGVPFSMVSALQDAAMPGYPLTDGRQIANIKPGEILVNRWTAEELGANEGDPIRVKYYEPESVDGEEVEREAEFRLAGIVELTEPREPYQTQGQQTRPAVFDRPPTIANDPWLTPEVPGVTDADSIEAWDLPFETSDKIRPQDDDYWQNHRTTPKGFISLADGQKLWASRFGDVTSYRIPAPSIPLTDLENRIMAALAKQPLDAGIQILPVKKQGLSGSQGSTPFDVLFLLFSMFVMISALLLLVLFVRLGLQQRGRELGLWLAVGFSAGRVGRLWWAESVLASLGGVLVGTLVGVGYAGVMIWLLRTAWVGAVSSSFLQLHWTWRSLVIGGAVGLLVCAMVMRWSIRQAAAVPVRTLLSGRWDQDGGSGADVPWWSRPRVSVVLFSTAILSSVAGLFVVGDAQAMAFMSGGMLSLVGLLSWIYHKLLQPRDELRFEWAQLGRLNVSRQPKRSLLIVGLVGIAAFLILAVSAFRLGPSERGTAGFSFVARTNTGIMQDLNSPTVRQSLLSQGQVESQAPIRIADVQFFGFRFHDGEHASCNNPFQAGQPQVLGVSAAFVDCFESSEQKRFAWVTHTANETKSRDNPWRLLQREPSPAIPVVIDKNTAWYSLKVYLPGTRFKVNYPGAGEVEFELVGLLDNSVLQGALLISEESFLRLFPRNSGYRYYLINASTADAKDELNDLGRSLQATGWQVRRTEEILANYLAVQNTYLSAFQSLGSLGLLLGTVGLVVAQFRSILERRRELALMQALGFPVSRIQNLVTRETNWLLGLGFGVGSISAAVGILPHLWVGAAEVPLVWLGGALGAIALIGWGAAQWIGRWAMQGNLLQLLRNQ
ncbi:MAG: ABC transporter permease [Planctomycetaceae bacterium]|nr:ABC transporter permease [Planctomycetaceae bacterium]